MATEALKKLMATYDFEHNGELNKAEWIKLCGHDTINLSPDLSATLFEGLDSDGDGSVKITDILNELSAWEASQSSSEMNVQFQQNNFHNQSDASISSTPETSDNASDKNKTVTPIRELKVIKNGPSSLTKRHHLTSLALPPDSTDQWTTQKEIHVDGSEVFSTLPVAEAIDNTRAHELESMISRSYPELLSPFKNVMEDFQNELRVSKYEQSNLEQTYLREKAARREDLVRLEEELELQIERIEERTKNELREKLQNEYQNLVCNKEKEIRNIRDQVAQLRSKIESRLSNTENFFSPDPFVRGIPASEILDILPPTPVPYVNHNTNDSDQAELKNILMLLTQRETELINLKAQLSKQEAQIQIDKRELLNQEEEKHQLYQQLDAMRMAMQRLNTTNDYLYSALQNRSLNSHLDNIQSSSASELLAQPIHFRRPDDGTSLPNRKLGGISPLSYSALDTHNLRRMSGREQYSEPGFHRTNYSSDNLSGNSAGDIDKFELLSHEAPTPKPPERIFKVIIVGNSGVGKSSYLYRFCDGIFYPHLRATVGIDFRTRNVRFENVVYTIQLWDTAGQEKYRSIIRSYFRKVDGVILMYDVTEAESYHDLKSWLNLIMDSTNDTQVPIMFVGNKIDLREAENNTRKSFVTVEMGQRLASTNNALFIETSVATQYNIEEAIHLLVREMKVREDTQVATLPITPNTELRKYKNCCS